MTALGFLVAFAVTVTVFALFNLTFTDWSTTGRHRLG